eukprot:CAMPEP_0174288152 /NCGR_PEP_ID=MMETSP0809-20121228/19310_1 /TAXON_ID=73025 ORGANISM="Eutreptiella gymnastica-like, Strain CCMP1594" /NCGR_SAMPLE_ID=MMETSP0809 /ASSEMBLY_ACC=CAM_ASM_000658 /LENGTH=661 /DNA_ID=CAMNT_0015385141 /DNA_START=48 /DNA_END=2033 /DNA_ORIENTATION=-
MSASRVAAVSILCAIAALFGVAVTFDACRDLVASGRGGYIQTWVAPSRVPQHVLRQPIQIDSASREGMALWKPVSRAPKRDAQAVGSADDDAPPVVKDASGHRIPHRTRGPNFREVPGSAQVLRWLTSLMDGALFSLSAVAAGLVLMVRRTRAGMGNSPLSDPMGPGSMRLCATVADKSEEVPDETVSDEGAAFNFFKHWWPVLTLNITDKNRPHKVMVLGQTLVAWWDKSAEQWRVFADRCPHRLAPLSEGRIEPDGNLMCAYHAWKFAGDGSCVALPQAPESESDKLRGMPKACAIPYPTREAAGLLWVWGEPGGAGSTAEAEAAAQRLPIAEAIETAETNPQATWSGNWEQTDMPYGWDTFLENVLDPAHVIVAHHAAFRKGTDKRPPFPNRYNAAPQTFTLTRSPTVQNGFQHSVDPDIVVPGLSESYLDFQPPNTATYIRHQKTGAISYLSLTATPTLPGMCRSFINTTVVYPEGQEAKNRSVPLVLKLLPKFHRHLNFLRFLFMDHVFLHGQEKILVQQGYDVNSKATSAATYFEGIYTPTQVDKSVLLFRRWLSAAGGVIPWPKGTPPAPERTLDSSAIFDVWNGHVKNCTVCQQGLRTVLRLRNILVVLGILRMAIGLGPGRLLSLAFFGAAYALDRYKQGFFTYEFSHADNP